MRIYFYVSVFASALSALLSLCTQQSGKQSKPAAKPVTPTYSRLIVGRWENRLLGMEFTQEGVFAYYREADTRVNHPGAYKFVAKDRIRIDRSTGTYYWIIKKLTKDALVVSDAAGHEMEFVRAKAAAPTPITPARRCETLMRIILTAEEQYNLDHAHYAPVAAGGSFLKAGLSIASEPKCPSGGVYSVVVDENGQVAIHCSVKEHDFGGKGLR